MPLNCGNTARRHNDHSYSRCANPCSGQLDPHGPASQSRFPCSALLTPRQLEAPNYHTVRTVSACAKCRPLRSQHHLAPGSTMPALRRGSHGRLPVDRCLACLSIGSRFDLRRVFLLSRNQSATVDSCQASSQVRGHRASCSQFLTDYKGNGGGPTSRRKDASADDRADPRQRASDSGHYPA
jgi:hypothetical protein